MSVPSGEDSVRAVQLLAEEVFESRATAIEWMATPNWALEGRTPLDCCQTEEGGLGKFDVSCER